MARNIYENEDTGIILTQFAGPSTWGPDRRAIQLNVWDTYVKMTYAQWESVVKAFLEDQAVDDATR